MAILIIKIMGMAFPQPFVWRNDIVHGQVENSFYPPFYVGVYGVYAF